MDSGHTEGIIESFSNNSTEEDTLSSNIIFFIFFSKQTVFPAVYIL